MKKSVELKQKRSALIDKQGELLNKLETEKRDAFTEDEATEFRSLNDQIEDLDQQIKDAEMREEAAARVARNAGAAGGGKSQKPEDREKAKMLKSYSLHKAIRSQLPNHQLDGVELEMHQELQERAKESGVSFQGVGIPSEVRATTTHQTVTEDDGDFGGNLVATDQRGVIPFLRPKPIIASIGATYLRGLTGDLAFPTNKGGISATWEGEVDTVDPTRNKYGVRSMKPKRLASTVEVSLQNILQSTPNLEAYTKSEMEAVIALKIDEAAISGPGSGGAPEGILSATGVNLIANGPDGAAPSWANIVDMETAPYVENANGAKMAYLINHATKGFLKKNKGDSADLTYMMTTVNELNGYNVGLSNLVPGDLSKGSGANLSAAIFGDFSQLIIGEWGYFDMVVDHITRKKEGLIEITMNSFLDILLRHPEAFSKVIDWDIGAAGSGS